MHTFKNTLKASKSYIQERKRNKGKPIKREVMILHKIRRPNSLKIIPSGVANYRNIYFNRTKVVQGIKPLNDLLIFEKERNVKALDH